MSRPLAVLVGVVAGCLVGMQAPINSRLGRSIGTLPAASFSFLVGTAVLLVITSIVNGGLGALGNVGKAPSWALIGGLLGAVYVSVALVVVRTLGAGRADRRRDHRPAGGVGRDRPLRAAGRGQAGGQRRSA